MLQHHQNLAKLLLNFFTVSTWHLESWVGEKKHFPIPSALTLETTQDLSVKWAQRLRQEMAVSKFIPIPCTDN